MEERGLTLSVVPKMIIYSRVEVSIDNKLMFRYLGLSKIRQVPDVFKQSLCYSLSVVLTSKCNGPHSYGSNRRCVNGWYCPRGGIYRGCLPWRPARTFGTLNWS